MAQRRNSRASLYGAFQRKKREQANKQRGPGPLARLPRHEPTYLMQYGRLRYPRLKDREESRRFAYISSTYAHLLSNGSHSIQALCDKIQATYDTEGDHVDAAKHRDNIAFLQKISH